MNRTFILLSAVLWLLAACSPAAPAATPAPAQQPARPQPAIAPTLEFPMAAPASAATSAPAAMPGAPAPQTTPLLQGTALPNFKPPQSGGALNPPTASATLRNNPANVPATPPPNWEIYREATTGLLFQRPRDWRIAISRGNKDTLLSLLLTRSASPITNTPSILIDVRPRSGELLAWLSKQLPAGRLLIDARSLEGGAAADQSLNAQLAAQPAVFVFAPAHDKTSAAAALFTADQKYVYQFTYLSDTPEQAANRLIYLRLLNTVLLSNTTTTGVMLPTTTFTTGLDLTTIK